ncbi:MAG: iron-sulfur cluster repair di-iron protein [Bacteroidota bacterium]|nr:iron-sulfur cluster repair di-iron protein [Bacteroidota bacterium]MDP4190277.1 iron-sulfur cluster repair di-iron protein [Bacteroidota bacterium]MDP4194278.1 iron-sulfur cluster repair di-iron protein [Bacteroidota bacterium]
MITTKITGTDNYSGRLIKDIVAEDFRAAAIFEKHGIDFCCKGKRALKDACRDKQLNIDEVITDLTQIEQTSGSKESERYDLWELDYLTMYIINNHHKYVQRSIPQITGHLEKIMQVHGKKHPYLEEVTKLFYSVSNELISHLRKEENILFPMVMNLMTITKANGNLKHLDSSIAMPIAVMEREHDSAGSILERIRVITNNFTLPEDACGTFEVTYKELDEFERDLHKHVFLENSILFPKAIALEKSLKQ